MAAETPPPLPLDADRALALAYVPHAARAGMEALWALDRRMADVVRAAREPGLGAIRLTWWREALAALDTAPVPPEPMLARVAATLLPLGVTGEALRSLPEGWAPLLEPERVDDAAIAAIGEARGATLFAAGARVLGGEADARVRAGGAGWALVDAGLGLADAAFRESALAVARGALDAAMFAPWPRALRPLGMLAALAAGDVRTGRRAPGSPARALRMAWHRASGR